MKKLLFVLFALPLLAAWMAIPVLAQKQSNFGKPEALQILKNAKNEIKKHYYDEKFHGINLDEQFSKAEEKVKQAQNTGQLMGIIAQTLLEFNDSHLYFSPPSRMNKFEYGFQIGAVGEDVVITAVKPGSDAEKQGLQMGDRVSSINGYAAIREKLWVLRYLFYSLRPQQTLRLSIKTPDNIEKTIDIQAKIRQGKQVTDLTNSVEFNNLLRDLESDAHLNRQRYAKLGDDLFIWKMTGFDVEESVVDGMMGRAKKSKTLILDLRGNGGGYVSTLQRLVGSVFDKEVKIADRNGRKEMKPVIAKKRGDGFAGKIIVLIDSSSGSAAEIFARVIQLEKRGTVLGDRSAGAVMESLGYSFQIGMDTIIPYGFSITDADVIMTDGKSLEHVGVTPDEMKLPTPKDLAAGRDPVLAYAIELAGAKISPEDAGKMFPIEWPVK